MNTSLKEIEQEISNLESRDKEKILEYLIRELDGPEGWNLNEAWHEEVQRRYSELRKGTVQALPSDQVMKKARDRLDNAG